MKKTVSVFLIISLIFTLCVTGLAASTKKTKDTDDAATEETVKNEKRTLTATSPHAILIDMQSGNVLYQKKATSKVYPASLTKIMTAVLALENGKLEEVVTAKETALSNVAEGDSNMGIKKGEKLSLRQLLYGMMLASAADAANVVAEYIGGDMDSFVTMMNKRAAELGMKNTNFVNPSGDHDERHFTTAKDMSYLARYAMTIPEFRDIVKCDSYKIPATEKYHDARTLTNGNHLVSRLRRGDYFYKYATGIKTGYTSKAKSCIAASAEKNGMQLLALVFEAKTVDAQTQSFVDCINMFDFVFENYSLSTVAASGEVVAQTDILNARRTKTILLETADDVKVIKEQSEKKVKINHSDNINTDIKAPVKKGAKLGTREYFINGTSIGKVALVADKEYKFDLIACIINKMIDFVTSPWFFLLIAAAIIVAVCLERRRRRLLRKKRIAERKRRNKELQLQMSRFGE